ncbi:hypothetical protein Tco_0285846 [Tanacetum coccineum]
MDMNLTQLCDLDPMIDDSKILARCINVIGTVVSVSDAIPFNNYGKDQLRRTIILEDVHGAQLDAIVIRWRECQWGTLFDYYCYVKVKYSEKEGFDPDKYYTNCSIYYSKKEITADDFL